MNIDAAVLKLQQIADSVSSTSVVKAGTPQGTVSGPNDFKLIINDLSLIHI